MWSSKTPVTSHADRMFGFWVTMIPIAIGNVDEGRGSSSRSFLSGKFRRWTEDIGKYPCLLWPSKVSVKSPPCPLHTYYIHVYFILYMTHILHLIIWDTCVFCSTHILCTHLISLSLLSLCFQELMLLWTSRIEDEVTFHSWEGKAPSLCNKGEKIPWSLQCFKLWVIYIGVKANNEKALSPLH